jgi:hypothetical protein
MKLQQNIIESAGPGSTLAGTGSTKSDFAYQKSGRSKDPLLIIKQENYSATLKGNSKR